MFKIKKNDKGGFPVKLVALCKNFALRIKSKINKDMKPAA